MKTAKLFKNGQSQAVRLPKDFRMTGDSVYINRVGRSIVLTPRDDPWGSLFDAARRFTPDFMAARDQGDLTEREGWG